ncbi:amidohydrolase [Christiangramia aquimixticola]|uniref:amidohydrolase n=1 Tax=Christiangramia aquimixticola TaxID=1697558 RepID=UPI003AA8BD47
MSEKLNVSLIQANLEWENTDANLQMFSAKIEEIKGETDLVILPEMFTTGFSMNAESLAEGTEGKTLEWMKKKAKEGNFAITGSVIIKESGNFYNRLIFVFPDGNYHTYDKRHTFTLAKEDKIYTAGTERLIVDYKGWKICPLVCYDLRFPVWARNTVDYDLLIYVANWPEKRIAAWDALLKARAIENMSYCIGLNRTGKDGNDHNYNGHSAVYDMLGNALSHPEKSEVFVSTFSLYKTELKDVRNKFKFLQDRDDFSLN